MNDFYENKRQAELNRKKNDERRKFAAQERLKQCISTHIRTTMIAAISAFEKKYGDLWGYNQQDELSDDQVAESLVWDETRTRILDVGNSQIRAALQELDMYDVNFVGDKTLYINKDNRNG